MVVTYVVPISRARAAVAGALNLVVVVCFPLAVVVTVAEPTSESVPGSLAIAAVGAAATAALFTVNLARLRRGYYLVRRPLLLGAPAGGYRVRLEQERR